jgi:hypothetical protein
MKLAVESISGEQVVALIRQVYATPKDVVAKASLAARGADRPPHGANRASRAPVSPGSADGLGNRLVRI